MKRKDVIFIICILVIILLVEGFDRYKEHMEQEKKNKVTVSDIVDKLNNPYKDFRGMFENDYEPDVLGKLNDTIQFRINKDKNTEEYDEAQIMVASAELLPELKTTDKENKNIMNVIEHISDKRFISVFKEELRYLYVNYSIRNVSDKDTKFYLSKLRIVDGTEFGRRADAVWSPKNTIFDYIKVKKDGCEVNINDGGFDGEYIDFEAGCEYEMEGLLIMLPGCVGDIYLVTNQNDTNYPNDQVAIELGVALYETVECDPTDGVISDYQKRDLKQLRINAKHTSYGYFVDQNEKYYFSDNHFYRFGETVGKPYEISKKEVEHGMEMTVLESELVNTKEELCENFKNSKYLDEMLNIYKEQFEYEEEAYRYVYLKVRLKEFGNMRKVTNIPSYLWLYNRDDDNNMWVFGYADDYYIVSSTNEKQTIDYQNIVMEQGEEIIVEAVYIVLPDTVYDLYIYNDGLIFQGDTSEREYYGAISLDIKQYEKGGIK